MKTPADEPAAGRLRSIEVLIALAAPPDTVWNALTDPTELMRWFALEARVEGGIGGRVWLSWGEPIVSESRIALWESGRRLRLEEERPLGVKLHPPGVPVPRRTLEYVLDRNDRGTVLRLTHSGFPDDPAFAETYDAVRRGWQFQVRALRHYLERHRGVSRVPVLLRRIFAMSPADVWGALEAAGAVGGGASGGTEGAAYSTRAATGDVLAGRILIADPPRQWAATTGGDMNEALFRITVVPIRTGASEASVWLAAYGVPKPQVDAFERRWAQLLDRLLVSTRTA